MRFRIRIYLSCQKLILCNTTKYITQYYYHETRSSKKGGETAT